MHLLANNLFARKQTAWPGELQQIGVVLQNRQDEGLHVGGKLILSIQIGLKDLAVQPHQDLAALQRQEALILRALVKALAGQEQGELVPVGSGIIGAEHGAVAALIAHPVHMEDLMSSVRKRDDHVGPVGADVGADLTDGVAVQAALALAPSLGRAEDTLTGDGLVPGDVGVIGDGDAVDAADDGIGEILRVGNALHHGGGAAHGVAAHKDVFQIGAEFGDALGVDLDAVGGEQVAVYPLAHGGDHRIAVDLSEFPGGDGAAAALFIGIAQLHDLTFQLAVDLLYGCHQLQEPDAVLYGQLQLLRVGGHILLRPAVYQRGGLGPGTESSAGRVHGGVAAAHHGHMAQRDVLSGFQVTEPLDHRYNIAGNVQLTGLARAHGEEDVGVAHGLQFADGGGGGVQLYLGAVEPHEGDVLLDGLLTDTEAGDHQPGHAAQLVALLKNGDGDTGPAQEVGCGDAGGTAADDGGLPAVGDRLRLFQRGHQVIIALLRRDQFGSPDLNGIVIVIPGALGLAAVGADGAGGEGEGVLLRDEGQGLGVFALTAQLDILRNILPDGAAALAGSGEAVHQRHLFQQFPPGQGLDVLQMVLIPPGGQGQCVDAQYIHTAEGGEVQLVQNFADLGEALIAAGLQLRGGHGDGPDAAGEQLVDVEGVGAAGVGQPQLAVKFPAQPRGHGGGQGEQALARHIHLPAGQFSGLHVHGEGVAQFETKFQTPVRSPFFQTVEHGDGVLVLQIFLEVVVIKGDIVIAHFIQNGAGGLIAQQSGVALDEGVQPLFLDEIGGDALDLLRRAAVEGGEGDRAGNPGGDGVDGVLFSREQLMENGDALLKDRCFGGVHHAVQEGVHLLTLDALQIVAHGHIEHEPVWVAQTVQLGHDLAGAPRLHVFLKGLRDGQLRGPLAVVALVLRQNTGAVDAGGQLRAVHLLNGFQLKEPGAAEVARHDVLGQLGVGAGSGAEGRFDGLSENGQGLAAGVERAMDAEHGTLSVMFCDDPGHQLPEGNGGH